MKQSSQNSLPAYSQASFIIQNDVCRSGIVDRVRALADKVSEPDGSQPPRTIVITGSTGMGKTWLSFHLKRAALNDKHNLRTFLIALDRPRNPDDVQGKAGEWITDKSLSTLTREDAATTARAIAGWLAEQLGLPNLGGRASTEFAALFRDTAQFNTNNKPVVLLLDSVFEAAWSLLEMLEETFLSTLAALPHVMIVITGRGKPYPWKSLYLRNLITEVTLAPFDQDSVRDQIMRDYRPTLDVEAVRRILHIVVAYCHGVPLNNIVLAHALLSDPKENVKWALAKLLEVQLATARHAAKDDDEYGAIGQDLEALCVLNTPFRSDEEMRTVLSARIGAAEPLKLEQVNAARDRLIQHHLLRWQDEVKDDKGSVTQKKGYVIDSSIKPVVNALFRLNNEPVWRQVNIAAQALYQKWANDYAANAIVHQTYQERANYHAAELAGSAESTAESAMG